MTDIPTSEVREALAQDWRETAPPILESGDRLTRCEFERRYACLAHVKKAELIEGVVIMGSPVRDDLHAEPHAKLILWLGLYAIRTPGVRLSNNATVRLDLHNEPQPDALLRVDPGGQSRRDEDGYIEGAPELIAEVAASSASYDLHDKLRVYQRNGVREYIVWRTADQRIDWFELADDAYRPLQADADGVTRSKVFPGLALAIDALLAGDFPTVEAALREAMATGEHEAFVTALKDA